MIILQDGNTIEAKVMEIHPSEIRYKRIDNLDGPMIIIPKDRVLSIKYKNGVVDIINASSAPATATGTAGNERNQVNQTNEKSVAGSNNSQQSGIPTPLQTILNTLPAIPIAGNNLKFQFNGEKWTATVNGENFSAGTVEVENTDNGSMLTLKQTHIWPGAVGKTAGRIAKIIPGGAAVGGALDTAGQVAGAVGAVEASGPEIVLEYKAGPPAKLSLVKSSKTPATAKAAAKPSDKQITDAHPLVAENRFDLDGFNVFALSIPCMLTMSSSSYGGGITITIFEKYKPNALFSPSYFLSGKYIYFDINNDDELGLCHLFALGTGILFKHRFPKNKVLWNFGASLEFMWAYGMYGTRHVSGNSDYVYSSGSRNYDEASYSGKSLLLGMGIQTGLSFRFNPYTSLDLNGLLKFPFGKVEMKPEHWKESQAKPENKSFWPFTGGIEMGLTFWFPSRSGGKK